jgi:hypothetical protein
MDRTAGGLAKTVKRNGDWSRFTVVKIASVEVFDDRQAGTVAPKRWDAGSKEFYINLKPDPDGRKLKIAAKLTKPLKNVRLHFMLAPSRNNRKAANWGLDMPGTWTWKDIAAALKHLDKADRKDFMHQSQPTDAQGRAESELRLSRFGGDRFKPGVYME